MEKLHLFFVASAILLIYVDTVNSAPKEGGTSAADAEREAWKKIREQTAEFLAHEREYVMSQSKPGLVVEGQPAVVEQAAAVVNSAPVAAAPNSDSAATTLPPVTTVAPTTAANETSASSVISTADASQTTAAVPAA